jgi:endoribonuclease Dicer
MPGKRLAQMAVALKACMELHEAKELDDHLQPVGRELVRYEDEDCEWEDHELHGQARPGSTKRKQYYHKKVMLIPFKCRRIASRAQC